MVAGHTNLQSKTIWLVVSALEYTTNDPQMRDISSLQESDQME
jgi:hypothetical protein